MLLIVYSRSRVSSAPNASSDKQGAKAQLAEAGRGANRGAGFSRGPASRCRIDPGPLTVSISDHRHATATVREA